VLAAAALTVGNGLTVTATVDVPVHPFAPVPVTVYVVEIVGETVTLDPDKLPGFQTYVLAPPPVNVVEPPIHIAVLAAAALTVGNGLTVTATVDVPVHPFAPVPVTVYVVEVVGETVTLDPDKLPGFQT
jgi:hypothetical protein